MGMGNGTTGDTVTHPGGVTPWLLALDPRAPGWERMMSNAVFFLVIATVVVATICVIAWGLLGPRRASDETGHHVELAQQTRERDRERATQQAPDEASAADKRRH